MAGFSLNQALSGAGEATAQVGMEQLRAAILSQRDATLAQYQQQRDDRLMAHQSAEAELNRGVTREGFQVTRDEGAATRANQKELHQMTDERIRSEGEATRGLQKELHQDTNERIEREGDKNRALDKERIQIQRDHLRLQGAHLALQVKQYDLAYRQGMIQIEKLEQMRDLEKQYLKETDPQKKEQIADSMYTLAQKDKVVLGHVTETDAEGNKITRAVPYNARTGQVIGQQGGRTPGKGAALLDQFLGGNAPAAAAPRSLNSELVSEPPGSQPMPGRDQGLAARKRRQLESEEARRQALRQEYGDAGY